jgi:hypothetical protein
MDITQDIIDQAPEGATHATPAGTYWKQSGDDCYSAKYVGRFNWERAASADVFKKYVTTGQVFPLQQKSTATAQPAAPLQTEREPDLICASDRAGIAAFVPPPEPQKVERPVRVSTVNRAWRWLL